MNSDEDSEKEQKKDATSHWQKDKTSEKKELQGEEGKIECKPLIIDYFRYLNKAFAEAFKEKKSEKQKKGRRQAIDSDDDSDEEKKDEEEDVKVEFRFCENATNQEKFNIEIFAFDDNF